jgi:hypothetical protein
MQRQRAAVSDGLGTVVMRIDDVDEKQLNSAHLWSALRRTLRSSGQYADASRSHAGNEDGDGGSAP